MEVVVLQDRDIETDNGAVHHADELFDLCNHNLCILGFLW